MKKNEYDDSFQMDSDDAENATNLLNDLWDEIAILESRPSLWDEIDNHTIQVDQSSLAIHKGKVATAIDHVLYYTKAKTYKYILITQLLGKAINEDVNILAMQSSSTLSNSWNARSLCEETVVQFEKDALCGILGSSKQPYNSTPGQFPELSKTNHARSSDIPLRNEMIDALTEVSSSEQARQALRYFLYVCKLQIEQLGSVEPLPELAGLPLSSGRVRTFLYDLSRIGREGEGLSLAIATLLSLFLDKGSYSVELYQINTSRKGRGDIDVFCGAESKFLTIEVKDKPFTTDEVEGYAITAKGYGWPRFMFIYGNQAGSVGTSPMTMLRHMDNSNVYIATCLSFDALLDSLLFMVADLDIDELRATVVRYLEDAKVKAVTRSKARKLLRELLSNLK